jgi:hypothetical protein
MEGNFELFEEGPLVRQGAGVHVTLRKGLAFYFNAQAHEALGRPAGVALLFDARQKWIGVMPSEVGRKRTFPLRTKAAMGEGRYVSATSFCRRHGIKPDATLAFTDAKVNRDGMMVLDLNKVAAVSRNSLPQSAQRAQR